MTASPLLLLADGPIFKQHFLLNVRFICNDTCNINIKTIFIGRIFQMIKTCANQSRALF